MSALALTPKFQKALDAYIAHIIADYSNWTTRSKMDSKERMVVTYEPGQKFVKIIHSTYGSRSVHSFVSLGTAKWPEGTLLKSASWKAPAQNFSRGNIYDVDSYKKRATWTGVY